jgi:hypothetical protein
MTSGCCSASDSKNLRHAENDSLRSPASVLVAADPEEGAKLGLDPPLLRLSDALRHRLVQLPLDFFRRIAFEDSRLCLDHLAERPERHAFAVRERAAVPPIDEVG